MQLALNDPPPGGPLCPCPRLRLASSVFFPAAHVSGRLLGGLGGRCRPSPHSREPSERNLIRKMQLTIGRVQSYELFSP